MNPQASYKSFWNDKASTPTGAMGAVDGSADESVLALTGRYTARQVTAALSLDSTSQVLELGCGVGRIGSVLAPRVSAWHGVDIAENMVEVARSRLAAHANARVTALTRTSLDMFPDASFDAAYCVAVFIHMDKEDWFIYLRELARVLKPGGRFYFDHWNLAHPIGWKRWRCEVEEYDRSGQGLRKDVARNQFTTPEEARLFLTHAGFDVATMWSDSPWVQALGVKRGTGDAALIGEAAACRGEEIVYSARWSTYFDRILAILMAGEHPQAFVSELSARTDEDSAMYLAWITGIWRQNVARWGAAP